MAFFRNVIAFINSHGQLCVSFKENDVGKEIKFVLSAQGFANFECVHLGANNPVVASKETVAAFVSTDESIKPKSGKIEATICIDKSFPTAGDFKCPFGQTLVLRSVTYKNIVLTDTTNGISVTINDPSRQF